MDIITAGTYTPRIPTIMYMCASMCELTILKFIHGIQLNHIILIYM